MAVFLAQSVAGIMATLLTIISAKFFIRFLLHEIRYTNKILLISIFYFISLR